ncbi:hypothetical protein IEO21_07278 [Rhodonia placenta]|uniref:DNA topoisomerase n=1 Tax=Rhodonia placenta TaxID=104341 RepID=A0A8H7NYU2_9APHY|nr:hypothetical protein IEO21_07278 [Postia placenta]
MRVLCVAEKPSVAKNITQILSGGQFTTRQTGCKYIKNYDFNYPQTNSLFTVTAVTGHVMDHEFHYMYSKWTSCDPFALFDAPIKASVKKEAIAIAQNLRNEAKRAQTLMIWTDCDREGENIGAEIAGICKEAHRNISIRRARFSAIIPQQIHNAAQHPVQLDTAQANAVEARILLDLRIGSAFTRLQTLNLQQRFEVLKDVISYGPCQFPTLGFVVSRYNQVKSFVPETFWYIYLSLSRPSSTDRDEDETIFTWRRGHLFDLHFAMVLYESVLAVPRAQIVKVTSKDTKKWKPYPLTTVDLQKVGSRLLRISPKKILDIAEHLYQQGFLSYPRTETDRFDPQFDFMTLLQKQTVDPTWGPFAEMLQNGGFDLPRQGKKDDKAHPPIHPTAYAGNLAGDEKRVYEYITRRFLACCSKDALGWQTTVDVEYGGEEFYATGLTVRERNYLEVFPYDKWSDKELPHFTQGEQFVPTVCELREGQTTRPALLTESDLVSMMDKNGIGTDATIAQHIQTIIDRNYVIERMQGSTKYLVPSTLGIGLVEGYDAMGFERSLSRPQLRRETERRMVEICEGTRTKADMLTESVEQYKEIYMRTKQEFERLVNCVGQRLQGNGRIDEIDDDDIGGGGGGGGGGDGGAAGGRGGGRGAGGARGGRGRRGGRGGAGGTRPDNDSSNDDSDDIGAGRGARRGRGARGGGRAARGPSSRRGRGAAPPAHNTPADGGSDEECDKKPSSSLAAEPSCACGVPAVQRTVVKETVNKGRQFWACGNDKTCDFFEWVDGPSSSSGVGPLRSGSHGTASTSKVIPAKRMLSERNAPRKMCECDLTAKLRDTQNGANKGRKFWCCPNESARARCKFFEWADDDATPVDQNQGWSHSTGSGGDNHSGECFKVRFKIGFFDTKLT